MCMHLHDACLAQIPNFDKIISGIWLIAMEWDNFFLRKEWDKFKGNKFASCTVLQYLLARSTNFEIMCWICSKFSPHHFWPTSDEAKRRPVAGGLGRSWGPGGAGGLAPRGTVHIPCVRVSTFIKAAIRRCNPTLENSEKCLLAGARGFYLPHWEGFPR